MSCAWSAIKWASIEVFDLDSFIDFFPSIMLEKM